MIKHTDKELISTLMELNTKVNGEKINRTDKVKKHGLTELVIKVTIDKVKNLDMESLNGLIVLNTKDISLKIIYMEKVFIRSLLRCVYMG